LETPVKVSGGIATATPMRGIVRRPNLSTWTCSRLVHWPQTALEETTAPARRLRLGSFHRPVDPRRLPPIRPAILANIFLWSQLFALLPPHSDGVFHIKITNAARAFDSPGCGTHAHTLPHNQTDRKHCRRSEPSAMLLPGTVTVSGKRSRSGLTVQWPKRRSRPSGRHAAVRKVISSNRTLWQ
jgi:hypothetical protein